jgi:uncharacterized protein YcfL
MRNIEAVTAFTRNSSGYGLTVRESCIIVAVANICAYKETVGMPSEATQAEINMVTGMEMRSTISRLKFWIESEHRKAGKIHKSFYWLNAKGIETVRDLLKFQEIDIAEVIKTAAAMK